MKIKKFYDEMADIYDKMIDFDKNLQIRKDAYNNIFPFKGKAVDIGCGIGLDSIALAMNGHEVTSLDISASMVGQAKLNAKKFNVDINAHVHSFGTIPKRFDNKFNFVVSVGNTIAHLTQNELNSAIKKIFKLLVPGGKVFLHILNYDLIIKRSKRINNIANRDGRVIIRFYDFTGKHIVFNILSFPVDNPKEYKLVSTKHYPHRKSEIQVNLAKAGFEKIKYMKNFWGDKFNVKESKDLFIRAIKPLQA